MKEKALLSASLSVSYKQQCALREVKLEVRSGEIVGLIGESGSGKSTLALALMGLLDCKGGTATGTIQLAGKELVGLRERAWRAIRGASISLVPQSPLSALNPAMTIGAQMEEAWRAHKPARREAMTKAIEAAFGSVSLPCEPSFRRRFPRHLSVGQAQRVLIAMAILHDPLLLIADEPTSALDVLTQREVLRLFARLNAERGMAILLISHDLLSVASLCHRCFILKDGVFVEDAETGELFLSPRHPYTRALIEAVPSPPVLSRDLARLAEQLSSGDHKLELQAVESAEVPEGAEVLPSIR